MEATIILGAFLSLIALMLVFFLYINRKWCFNQRIGGGSGTKRRGFSPYGDENVLPSKYVHKISNKKHYDIHSSSDSEDEIIRRLRFQQSTIGPLPNSGKLPKYNSTINEHTLIGASARSMSINGQANRNNTNYGSYQVQHVKESKKRPSTPPKCLSKPINDPLGVAERGKVGVAPTSSECSSNSSVEASIESNTGLINGEKKDRRKILPPSARSLDSSSTTTTLRETRTDDNRRDRSNSDVNRTKYQKLKHELQQQKLNQSDSINILPDISNNNQDCIVILSQDQSSLFDTSDLKSLKSDIDTTRPTSPTSLSNRYGVLEISLLYDAPMRKMTVHVLEARGIPTRDGGQPTHTQVRLLMLPNKKQKHKTKIRTGENPQFIESFLLHRVNPEEVNSMGLRVRVYCCERMRRERLIGEAIISFATIDLELETNLWLSLEPKTNGTLHSSTSDLLSLARSESTGSTSSMQHGGVPELLLALAYNGTTGRLTVEVVKGSHFRSLALNKAPDTYVKLCLVSSIGQEMARAKTSTRRGQPNPLFKETFVFQVTMFQLNDVTLMVSIYAKRNMKRNEMVGWFSLGLNSSGPEEMAHWTDMRETTRGEPLARWHVLVDS